MNRLAAFLIALGFLLVSGLVHGMWGNRWGTSEALEAAVARVSEVPLRIGAWQGKEIVPTAEDQSSFEQAGALAFWMRSYTHPRHQGAFTVILMCGRPGRMSVHTPEVCYRGAGYEMDGQPSLTTLKQVATSAGLAKDAAAGGDDEMSLWTARFRKHKGTAEDLRLFWAWSDDGRWQAPSQPRWVFSGSPFLYKLYVSRDGAAATESAHDFLRQLLPELRSSLFTAAR